MGSLRKRRSNHFVGDMLISHIVEKEAREKFPKRKFLITYSIEEDGYIRLTSMFWHTAVVCSMTNADFSYYYDFSQYLIQI